MIYLKSFLVFSVILIIFFSPISDLSALDFKVKEREKIEKSFVLGLKLFKDELYIPAAEVFSELFSPNDFDPVLSLFSEILLVPISGATRIFLTAFLSGCERALN